MKKNIKYFSLTIITGVALVMTSCGQMTNKHETPKEFEKLPKPKEETFQLKSPDPIHETSVDSAEKISLGSHGFVFSVAGKPLMADFNLTGDVVSIKEHEIVINSSEKGEVTMRYNLPGQLQIRLKPGEKLKIDFRNQFYLNSYGYTLLSQIEKKLLHTSAKISNSDPLNVEIYKGLSIQQVPGEKIEEQNSDFGVVRQIPVLLYVNDKRISLTSGKVEEIEFNDSKYDILVIVSTEMHPTEKKLSSSEGEGFTLEYAIVKK